MSRRIFAGTGRAQIELGGGMKRAVERVLSRGSLKRVADRMEDAARKVWQHARDNWPEKTGRSREALEYGLRLPDTSTLEAYVGFDPRQADYHFYIRAPYPHNNRLVWRTLIRTPARRMTRRLARELKDDLDKIVGGR